MTDNNDATFRGRLVTGRGEAAGFCGLDWFCAQIEQHFGFRPFAGTLNLELSGDDLAEWRSLPRDSGLKLKAEPGYCAAACLRALVQGAIPAAIVLPDVADYPDHVIEIVAADYLRAALNLEDGALVTVAICR